MMSDGNPSSQFSVAAISAYSATRSWPCRDIPRRNSTARSSRAQLPGEKLARSSWRIDLTGYDPQSMNHPGEEHQQAKQDVDQKIRAEAPFQSNGDRRQENGEQDQDQLVHDCRTPHVRGNTTSHGERRPITSTQRVPENKALGPSSAAFARRPLSKSPKNSLAIAAPQPDNERPMGVGRHSQSASLKNLNRSCRMTR